MASKTKVAPMSKVSIPHLELLACLILSHLIVIFILFYSDFFLSEYLSTEIVPNPKFFPSEIFGF